MPAASQSSCFTASGAKPVATAHSARQTHHFRDKVTRSDRGHGWFQMRATTNNYVRIYANRGTHWDGWDWGDMRSGHHVNVHAFRSHGRWIASTMQNWHEWGNGGWATTTRTLESGTWAARTTAAGMTEVGT